MSKAVRLTTFTGQVRFGALALVFILAPIESESWALPWCEINKLNYEISRKATHVSDHSFSSTELISVNNGAVYSTNMDGKRRILRFGISASDTEDFTRIAQLMTDSGFGVQLVGVITDPPDLVIRSLGLDGMIRRYLRQESLAEITKEIDLFEYIDGLEIKGKIMSRNKSFLSEINWHAVIARLEAFLEFCNSKGILIGGDFAYFVTRDSRVLFFDWDYYRLSSPEEVAAKNTELINGQISVMKSRIDSND